jgi:head-tail adaptor
MPSDNHVRAGNLRNVIRIMQPPTAQDAAGSPTIGDDDGWTEFCTTRAAYDSIRGREIDASGREVSERYDVFEIRDRNPRPDETMQVWWTVNSTVRKFEIKRVHDQEGMRRKLLLECREVK